MLENFIKYPVLCIGYIFWGPTISNCLQLMVTDGCIQEYYTSNSNCGNNKAFPSAIHALCYYHLAVQGILKYLVEVSSIHCHFVIWNEKYMFRTDLFSRTLLILGSEPVILEHTFRTNLLF